MQRLMIIVFLGFLTACSLAPAQATQPPPAVSDAATVEAIPPMSQKESRATATVIVATATATPATGELRVVDGGVEFFGGTWQSVDIEADEVRQVDLPGGGTGWAAFRDGQVVAVTSGGEILHADGEGNYVFPEGKTYRWDGTWVEILADGAVMSWADGLPASVSVNGVEVRLAHPGIWITKGTAGEAETSASTADEVRWWNKQTETFEVLEHIQPEDLVYQGNWVTAVATVVGAQSSTGNYLKYPVAVVDLSSGELARGDYGSEAPQQVHYDRAVKKSDGWYLWEAESRSWQPVTDEIMQVVLEVGEDPNDDYAQEKWADGTYLVKKYNGARLAVKKDSGWEPITDLTVKYGKYLNSVRSIDQLVWPQSEWSFSRGDMHVQTAARYFRGVFVDYETHSRWFEPSVGKYVTLYTVTLLVPLTPADWQTVRVVWGTSYPQPIIGLAKIIKAAGGGASGKTLTLDPARAWSLLRPGQVVDARVWTKVTGSNLAYWMQKRQADTATLFSRLPETVAEAGSAVSLPAGLTVYADSLDIPLGY